MDGSLVLLSGGLDSAVALAWAQRHLPPVRAALHFSYGQKCEIREYEAAYRLADYYAVPWFHYIIPTFEYNATCPIHSEITPARNLIFMAYAESLCESQEIGHLLFGAHADDGRNGCICRWPKVLMASWLASEEYGLGQHIHIPFAQHTKADVVTLGRDLLVPFELTWSCYEGGTTPCGTCASCSAREEAIHGQRG